MSATTNKFYIELAAKLEASPQGERGQIIEREASFLKVSRATLYRNLKKIAGFSMGRKPRADAGNRKTTRELALMVAGLVQTATRENGKETLSIKDACENLEAQGYGAVDAETGEVTMPSVSALARAMKEEGCHPKQLAVGSPSVRMRSKYPNHVWQIDASVCVLFYLPGDKKKLRLMDERRFNEKKPGNLVEIGNFRIIRYVLADHTSHCLYVRYERAKGEDATGMITTLINAMADRGGRDPMHGVPNILYVDKSGGNRSSLVKDFCKALDIKLLYHEAGNARATGSVEVAQNIVERKFEGLLRFDDIAGIEALQEKADAWRLHFNAHAIHTRHNLPRNRAWLKIKSEQLRTAQREVLETLANWGGVSKPIGPDFTISVNTRTSHGVQEYDLRMLGYEGLNVRDTVTVTLNPFKAPSIFVSKTFATGAEKRWEVAPIIKDENGFDVNAPVYGQSFKSHAETASEKAAKEIEALAARGYSQEAEATGAVAPREAAQAGIRPVQQNRVKAAKPFAYINPYAHVKEAPETLRRQGTAIDLAGPSVFAMPLSHIQAAKRLRKLNREPWENDAVACMAQIKSMYPETVPETALEALAVALVNKTPVNVARFIKPESFVRLDPAEVSAGGVS